MVYLLCINGFLISYIYYAGGIFTNKTTEERKMAVLAKPINSAFVVSEDKIDSFLSSKNKDNLNKLLERNKRNQKIISESKSTND